MTRERIDALERDRRRLQAEIARLQARLDQVVPENARLDEALGNAEANNVLATILIGAGGFLVSYATWFPGRVAKRLANAAAGCLVAGIVMMLWQSVRRWRKAAGGSRAPE